MRDTVILVTGGSRGIGRAIVERLAQDGPVAFTWRSDEAAAQEVCEVTAGVARAYHLDLKDRGRPEALIKAVEADMGPVDGLVNNAGMERSEILAMSSFDSWDEVIDTNLGGTFRMCRAALRAMVSRRRGNIVNISSLSAIRGVSGQAAYAASKAGLLAMTRCLAREMGRRDIRVNAVIPGYVATGMTAHLSESVVEQLRDPEVLKRGVTPKDVAGTVAFLLSDDSAATTGQSLIVDAGNMA